MPAGNERGALLRVADRLCAEMGYMGADEDPPGARPSFAEGVAGPMLEGLSPEDESLVAAIRWDLAKVAAAASAQRRRSAPQCQVGTALDAAELVMRGELARGNAEQLPALIPSFVFLVALLIVEQDEALEISRRTSELIEAALA